MYLNYIYYCVCASERTENKRNIYVYILFISVYSNGYNGDGGGGVGGEKHNIKWVRARGAADAPT